MEDESELAEIILDIAGNKEKYIRMGQMAKKYYDENRTPQHMADGFWKAIEYAYKQ